MSLVHHAEDPKAISLDLLNEVTIEGEDLQGRQILELADFIQVRDIIAMEIDGLEVGEIKQLLVNGLQIVI